MISEVGSVKENMFNRYRTARLRPMAQLKTALGITKCGIRYNDERYIKIYLINKGNVNHMCLFVRYQALYADRLIQSSAFLTHQKNAKR